MEEREGYSKIKTTAAFLITALLTALRIAVTASTGGWFQGLWFIIEADPERRFSE
jgi:hypothetical protein